MHYPDALPTMTISLENIYPLIVPADYYKKGRWELPHHNLPNQAFILSWVTFNSSATMNYLSEQQYQELTNKHDGWQQKAFENLKLSIADNENFCTQYKMSADGQQLLWLCFMHSDGIGSSRILLSTELTKAFPQGYYVAFPDRSSGLAIAKDISEDELKEIRDLIKSMHKGATTAMSGQLHSPADFTLPEQWTRPIDERYSDILTNEILKLTVVKL
jgi:hypothetical protein